MNVADQFKQVNVFLANNRFVPILEQMTASFVAMVKIYSITGQQASHEDGKRNAIAAQQEMKMIVKQGPGKTLGAGVYEKRGKAIYEHAAILIVAKYFPSLDPAHDNMLQQSRHVDSGFAWHEKNISDFKP